VLVEGGFAEWPTSATTEKGDVLLQVGPEAFLTCGALVMASWAGKRIRVTVEALSDVPPENG